MSYKIFWIWPIKSSCRNYSEKFRIKGTMATLFGCATASQCSNWTIPGSFWLLQVRTFSTTTAVSCPLLGSAFTVRNSVSSVSFRSGKVICVWVKLVNRIMPWEKSNVKYIENLREELEVGSHDRRVCNACRKEVRSVFVVGLKRMIDSMALLWTLRTKNRG